MLAISHLLLLLLLLLLVSTIILWWWERRQIATRRTSTRTPRPASASGTSTVPAPDSNPDSDQSLSGSPDTTLSISKKQHTFISFWMTNTIGCHLLHPPEKSTTYFYDHNNQWRKVYRKEDTTINKEMTTCTVCLWVRIVSCREERVGGICHGNTGSITTNFLPQQ